MQRRSLAKTAPAKIALVAGTLVMALAPLFSAAQAQDYPPTRGDPSTTGYDYRSPPPEPSAPNGYDGRDMPPPPPGYSPSQNEAALRDADDRYASEANRWARDTCVKSQSNAGSGALIGGILGAIIGSGMGGRHDHGEGMAAGAAIGAIGGAAIGSTSSNDTSPGCPPGYSVRNDASSYAYPSADYYYAAPSWYRPWVYMDGYWGYRPYPYHDYYYRTYRAGPGYYSRNYRQEGHGGNWGGDRGDRGRGDWGHGGGWEHRRR